MKSPIALAREIQSSGHTVSFWAHRHTRGEIEINIHGENDSNEKLINKTMPFSIKNISEFLSAYLNGEIKHETNN